MARPKSYEDLIVWQKAMLLAGRVYRISEGLPRKVFGLVSQLRRAAVSVPSNIAEGFRRLTDFQFRHFLGNARGSLYEMQTQLRLASDLGYFNQESVGELINQTTEVARLLNALITSIAKGRQTSSANAASAANSAAL